MKTVMLLIGALLCAISAQAMTPEAKTKNIRWVWSQTMPFLKACVFSDLCPLNETEKALIQKVVLLDKSYSAETIVLKSEKEDPGFFQTGSENHRLMVTGLKPGPIYLNSDRLIHSAMSLSEDVLFGLFVHELIHHLGYKDEAERLPDQVGAKLAANFKKMMVPVDVGREGVEVFILNLPPPLREGFDRTFPQGIHSQLVFKSEQHMSSQIMDRVKDAENAICGAGNKLWSTTSVPSFISQESSNEVMIELRLTARCYLTQNPALQEVIYFAQNKVRFDAANDVAFGSYVFVKFSHASQSSYLKIQNLKHANVIQAGQTWTGDAEIISPRDMEDVQGCAGNITSDAWEGSQASEPLLVQITDCQILSAEKRRFKVRFSLKVPVKAPHQLEFFLRVLALKTKTGYSIGSNTNPVKVLVHGGQTQPLTFIGMEFVGSQKIPNTKNGFYVPQGTIVPMKWKFDREVEWIDGFVDFQAQFTTRDLAPGITSLPNDGFNPRGFPPREIVAILLNEMVGLDSQWNYFKKNISTEEYMLAWVVKQ